MFTGIIKEVGYLEQVQSKEEGKSFWIRCPDLIDHIAIDDSVAVNGVCLTAEVKKKDQFRASGVHTTLNKSTLGRLKTGSRLNLELALSLNDRLGGHLVQGHVNGIGRVANIKKMGQHILLNIRIPNYLKHYVVDEGSIAINGISLTMSQVQNDVIELAIIPHTMKNTNLKFLKVGDEVNLETDVLVKYVEKLMAGQKTSLNMNRLTELGY